MHNVGERSRPMVQAAYDWGSAIAVPGRLVSTTCGFQKLSGASRAADAHIYRADRIRQPSRGLVPHIE